MFFWKYVPFTFDLKMVGANWVARMARTKVLERDVFGARMMGAVGVRIRMGRLLQGARVALRFLMRGRCYFMYTLVYTPGVHRNVLLTTLHRLAMHHHHFET